jgi:hypothetical protein
MAYSCSTLGSVKKLGAFEWYIFLLTDGLSDALRRDIEENFDKLGEIVGENAVVIKGYDPQRFRREVREAYSGIYPRLGSIRPPALFVTELSPKALESQNAQGRAIVFSLKNMRPEHGSVADFLSVLADSLTDPETLSALDMNDIGFFEKKWSWVSRYLSIQPDFLGFKADVGKMLEDLAKNLDRSFPKASA